MPMMAREVTYIKQDKPDGENLPAFLRYNKSLKYGLQKKILVVWSMPTFCPQTSKICYFCIGYQTIYKMPTTPVTMLLLVAIRYIK